MSANVASTSFVADITSIIRCSSNVATDGNNENYYSSLVLSCFRAWSGPIIMSNQAKTCQQREEVLSRLEKADGDKDDGKKRKCHSLDNNEIFYDAGNMSEPAKIPRLLSASKKAASNAKQYYEIYGGKYSSEPHLDHVPKKAKIAAIDVQSFLEDSQVGVKRQRLTKSFWMRPQRLSRSLF